VIPQNFQKISQEKSAMEENAITIKRYFQLEKNIAENREILESDDANSKRLPKAN